MRIVDGGDRVLCFVKDYGVGIPPELLEQIFSRTKKTSHLGTGGEKGTGFGMPIVFSLMTEFGGEINIRSQTGEKGTLATGTLIALTFPKKRKRGGGSPHLAA